MASVDAVIVGGGIAGLSAAYELSRGGTSFVVLERAARAGGVIVSEHVDGFTVDGGPDSLLIQKPAGIKLCEELGLGDRLVVTKPPRVAYIQRAGRLHPLPAASVLGIPTRIGPFARTTLFSWTGKLRMAAEVAIPPKRDDEDESIGAFITRRFGAEARTYLAEPLLAGIHAGDVDRLSMRSLFPRLLEAEQKHGSLLRAFRQGQAEARPPATAPGPAAEGAFKSLPGGLSEMIDALVTAIGAAHVRTGVGACAIAGRGPFEIRPSTGEPIAARAVILATPAYATSDLLRDRDEELARLAGEVRYASAGTIAFGFRRDAIAHPLTGSGFVVPKIEGSPILAASWLSSKWPHRAPEHRALLRTFVGGARDPEAIGLSDRELISRSLEALTPLLGISGAPLFTRVYRFERGNAQHEVGHLARMASIDQALARHPGLFLTGSGFRGVGIPDCVADARETARQAIAWLQR